MQVGPSGTAPPQANDVEAGEIGDLTARVAERDKVTRNPRKACYHGAFANARVLMNRRVSSKKRVIPHRDVTANDGIVGESDRIADSTIVADMRAGHEKTTLADDCDPAAVLGAGVHGDAFAQFAARADDQARCSAAVVHRLRWCSQRRKRIHHGALANRRHAGHVHMGDQPHAVTELGLRSNNAIGPDLHALAYARAIGNARAWIDHDLAPAIMAPTSASAIRAPSTLASGC